MPNAEQIRKTQERRAARAGRVKANEQASVDQEKELAALSDRLRGVTQPDPDADAEYNEAGLRTDQVGMAAPVVAKAAPKSRSAQKVASQIAAEAQADRDVRATVAPLDKDAHDLSAYAAAGTEPPLHVLNAIARRADNAIKDDARVAAQAAGKAAYEALTEHKQRGPEARHKKIEQYLRAAASAKSQVGAADPEK